MIIGCSERRDVGGPEFPNIVKRAAAPREGLTAKTFNQQICHHTCMTTIAVGKWVNSN